MNSSAPSSTEPQPTRPPGQGELPVAGEADPPLAWGKFIESIGISRTTAFRWRAAGLIDVVNLHGRPYVLRSEVCRFNARLLSGEFARTPKSAANLRRADAAA